VTAVEPPGVSKLAVSRRFVALSAERVSQWMAAHLNVGILRDRDHQQRQQSRDDGDDCDRVASRGRSMKIVENMCQP
jgi:hypothetical protein